MNHLLKFLLVIIACSQTLFGALLQTDSFDPLFWAADSFTPNSLVILDVDRVLIEPKDAIMRLPNQRLLFELRHKHASHLSPLEMAEITSIVSLQERSSLIEERAVEFINRLKARNIPVMALTAVSSVGFGKIPSVPDWRIAELSRLNISFESTFTHIPPFELAEITGRGPSPLFKGGILFSGGYPKGDVLEAFLDSIGFIPDKVLFADDQLYNLISVHNSLAEMGVDEIHVFHYLGANQIPNTINQAVADLQIKTLYSQQLWLSDDLAIEALTSKAVDSFKL